MESVRPAPTVARQPAWRVFVGSCAVVLDGVSACMWAYWGSIEAFHEGWWHRTLLAVALVFGSGPAWRVAHRFDDGDRGQRVIEGNGLTLTWAPAGPGWPPGGVSWDEAVWTPECLSSDGGRVLDTPQHHWRLPTRAEVVASMVRHSKNAGGTFDAGSGMASYRQTPDKETPLWNPRSDAIYWWTSDEIDSARAWSVTYSGGVFAREKTGATGTLGFRLVRR